MGAAQYFHRFALRRTVGDGGDLTRQGTAMSSTWDVEDQGASNLGAHSFGSWRVPEDVGAHTVYIRSALYEHCTFVQPCTEVANANYYKCTY